MAIGKKWNSIFKVWRDDYLPRFPYVAKISLKNEEEIKTFPDKGKLRICHQNI